MKPRSPTDAQLDLLGLAVFCDWKGETITAAELGRLHHQVLGVDRAAPNIFRDLTHLAGMRLLRHPKPRLYEVTEDARRVLDERWNDLTAFHQEPRRFLLTMLARLPRPKGSTAKARDLLIESVEEAQMDVIGAISKRPHPELPRRIRSERLASGVPAPDVLLALMENFETALLLAHLRFLDDLDDYLRGKSEVPLQITGADLDEAVAREHGTKTRPRTTRKRT